MKTSFTTAIMHKNKTLHHNQRMKQFFSIMIQYFLKKRKESPSRMTFPTSLRPSSSVNDFNVAEF
jgi:hypothetical protein